MGVPVFGKGDKESRMYSDKLVKAMKRAIAKKEDYIITLFQAINSRKMSPADKDMIDSYLSKEGVNYEQSASN